MPYFSSYLRNLRYTFGKKKKTYVAFPSIHFNNFYHLFPPRVGLLASNFRSTIVLSY